MNEDTTITIVDVETTHVNTQLAHIIEIAVEHVDLDTGKRESVWDTLVHPYKLDTPEWATCWFMEHSKVDPAAVLEAPLFDDLKGEIQEALSKYPVTAFNLSFDMQVLYRHGVTLPRRAPCLMLACKNILKLPGKYGDFKYPSLAEAWNYFFPDTPFQEQHRAGFDAAAGAKIALKLHQRHIANTKQRDLVK